MMALTGSDILMNADLFKVTFPGWPALAPRNPDFTDGDDRARRAADQPRRRLGGLTMMLDEAATWADPLDRGERSRLARMLARSCKRTYDAARFVVARDPQDADVEVMRALTLISAEMSELHLDVTERAEVPAR